MRRMSDGKREKEQTMRPIDADLLIQDTIQEYARSKQYRDAITRMVNKAPTIEPKKGEWIDKGNWMGIECSRCKCHSRYVTPFCPQCGARMKGVEDE